MTSLLVTAISIFWPLGRTRLLPVTKSSCELQSYGVGIGLIAAVLIIYTIWFVCKKAPKIIV